MQDTPLRLRAARRTEADQLIAFYEKNRDRFLLPRPYHEFAAAIGRGQYFLVERGSEILAGSGVFDYAETQPFVELAETFVSPVIRGFGLQGVFFRLRFASVVLFQGPLVGITTAVDGNNKLSLATTITQGFAPWSKPIAEAYGSCPTCPNRRTDRVCCCDFYLLPLDKAREAVGRLLAETESGSIALHNKNGDELFLSCSCSILTGEQRTALQEFVVGATW